MTFEKQPDSALVNVAGKEVHWKADDVSAPGGFLISATARGVRLSGDGLEISDQHDLQAFAKAVSDAWGEYLKLKKPLKLTNLAGH